MQRDKPEFDPYAELGIAPDARADEVEAAYRSLVVQHHPDVAVDPRAGLERTKRLNAAHALLSDPKYRAVHRGAPDEHGRPPQPAARALSAGLDPRRAFHPDPSAINLNGVANRAALAAIVLGSAVGLSTGLPALIGAAFVVDFALVALALRLNGPASDTRTWADVGISAAIGTIVGSVAAVAVVWGLDRIAHGLLTDVATMVADHAGAWTLLIGIPAAVISGALLSETRWAATRAAGRLAMTSGFFVGAACVVYLFIASAGIGPP